MDGKITDVRLNMSGLMQVSNQANDQICAPMARRAAAASGYSSATVQISDRPDAPGWARSRVLIGPADFGRERHTGRLARALGQ